MPASLLTASLALLTAAPAQTFVVDASNGPGTNFTTIIAAIAAVPDGAVLLVRAGNYHSFTIAGKSLRILGETGVVVHPPGASGTSITISGLAQSKTVVLRDLTVAQGLVTGSTDVTITNCLGPVLLQRVRAGTATSLTTARLNATDCDRLLIREHHQTAGTFPFTLTNCNTVVERSFLGFYSGLSFVAGVGVTLNGGTLQLIDCCVQGGVDLFGGGTVHAVAMNGGELRLLAGTELQAGFTVSGAVYAVAGTGNVLFDPSIVMSTPNFAAGVTATSTALPRITTGFTGSVAQVQFDGEPGQLGAIALALPGPRIIVPGIDGAIWLDGATFTPVTLGIFAAGVPITATLPWAGGAVPAVRAVWQGIAFDPAAGLRVSNPSFVILP